MLTTSTYALASDDGSGDRAPVGPSACSPVRAVLELAGIRDVLSKASGSTNPKNLVKATFDALAHLRSRESVESLRGVSLAGVSQQPAGQVG